MAETSAALPQRKMSRYRAQRVQDASDVAPPVPAVPSSPTADSEESGIARSKSRYRKIGSVSHTGSRTRLQQDAVPSLPPAGVNQTVGNTQELASTARGQEQHGQRAQPDRSEVRTGPRPEKLSRRVDSGTTLQSSSSQHDMNAKQRPRQASPPMARSQQLSPKQKPASPPVVQSQPDGKLFPPPKPQPVQAPILHDGPPASGQIRATSNTASDAKMDSAGSAILGLFRRKRNAQDPPKSPPQPLNPLEKNIKVGGGGAVPGTDAPVSAVNAGDRRVLIECGSFKMTFPVTPTTTPVDLIKSAATAMSDPINVKSAVLLEHFVTVGVHRPLRRYEHIRDVMNSWDNDTQNSLLLIDPATGKSELELSLAGVPKTKPVDQSWLLYYSQAPGKWDKRLVHLRRDGQITLQKDPKKPSDQTLVCHLSDFDVYTPTSETLKKKVKPPRKHCVAVKSQQKSVMFENTTNFVHFFCSGDQAVSENFSAAVQAWRSWYLVNVLGDGKKISSPVTNAAFEHDRYKSAAQHSHKRIDSLDDHYQLGTFSPLIDLGQFSKNEASNTQPTGVLAEDEPVGNLPLRTSLNHIRRSDDHNRPTDLASTAALGRRQSQRRTTPPNTGHTVDTSSKASPAKLRKGRAVQHDYLETGIGLVQAARSREAGLDMPTSPRRSGTLRARQARPTSLTQAELQDDRNAFTGEGLLASTQDGWGGGSKGRGVVDGSHAKGPLVDMNSDSEFAKGTLLHRVAKEQALAGPIIDRQKYVERKEKTGEGY